jgi:hypothetical protein
MVPICVSEPTGTPARLRTTSTPAINVVATEPSPTIKMPSLPLAAAISVRVTFFVVAIFLNHFLGKSQHQYKNT